MKSYKALYRLGPGPSSSHTLGPQRAAKLFKENFPDADHYEVDLYGSLSLTGKGHLTDYIIIETMKPKACYVHFLNEANPAHANTMVLKACDSAGAVLDSWTVYSVGGGAIKIEGQEDGEEVEVYHHQSLKEIRAFCEGRRIRLAEYTDCFEEHDDFINQILDQMMKTVEEGLSKEGVLPGRLQLQRVAKALYEKSLAENDPLRLQKSRIIAYAYAAAEQNASGGMMVTAPTLGASGVLPAVVRYYYIDQNVERERIVAGLKIASIIGNLIKSNATISGAQGGCQAEIGAACAMASAFVAHINGLDDAQIEYAAEIGMEHFLGLTCDPVGGYVMIPCIERNSVAALRAVDAALIAESVGSIKENRVSFDMVVNTMKYTGSKLAVELKETSLGGLASVVEC